MRRRISCTLLLFVTVIGCALGRVEHGPATDVPEMLKQFPGYHVVTRAERSADASAYLLRHYSRTNPSVVRADFDGDGHPDYALLLKHDGSPNAKFVVLLCSDAAQCRTVYELDVTASIAEMYLTPVPQESRVSPTGAIDRSDDSAGVKLQGVGIQLNYFEKAAVVYYWSKRTKRIEAIETED